MDQLILKKIEEIEEKNNVKVLFAVESGSRAWGFHSVNSDYDVRFIYVHKLSYYLSTQNHRDVIEVMDGDLDCSGWELRKALNLLAKGNPPLLEWLYSPIVYVRDEEFMAEFEALALQNFAPRSAIYHYLGMAKRNYNQYIKDKAYVKLKKYLYVIRPLLNCIAIQEQGKMPPTAMDLSMGLLERYEAHSHLVQLIEDKKAGKELDMGPANIVLNNFIEETMFFYELFVDELNNPKVDYSKLNWCLYNQVMKFDNAT